MIQKYLEVVRVLFIILISEIILTTYGLNVPSISEDKCTEYKNLYKNLKRTKRSEEMDTNLKNSNGTEVISYILYGRNALLKEYPHMAALGYGEYNNISWRCGGTLISEKFILTAAHCTNSANFGSVKFVQLGDIKLNGPTSKIYFVKSINLPAEYDRKIFYNDIALLELNSVVFFSPAIFPACIPKTFNPNIKVSALGWGETEKDVPSEILQTVDLEFFPNCSKLIRKHRRLPSGLDEKSQMCYGHRTERKDTCAGDSGGPLNFFDENNLVFYVIGITSFGKDCGIVKYPAIYTNVSNYVDWIEGVVWPE